MTVSGQAGAWTRVRRAAASLTPEAIEQIAQRVAQLLRYEPGGSDEPAALPHLVDAGQLARLLGVSRQWIYEHANELGAITIGDGSKPRLRFDPAVASLVVERRRRRAPAAEPQLDGPPRAGRPRGRRTTVPLLPVYESKSGQRRIVARARSVLAWRRGA
jgi:hypothetical protein